MAVSFVAAGAWASGSTSVTPALPTGWAAGDLALLFVHCKPHNATINTPTGWTKIGEVTDGTVAMGVDAGSVKSAAFYRVLAAGDSAPAVSISSGNVTLARVSAFRKEAANEWVLPVPGSGGGDTTADLTFSVTAATDPGFVANDVAVASAGIRSDAGTQSLPGISAPGTVMATAVEIGADGTTTTGNDLAAQGAYASVTTGPSTGPPTYSSTLAAAHTGSAFIVRVREQAPAVTHAAAAAMAGAFNGSAAGALALRATAGTGVVASGGSGAALIPPLVGSALGPSTSSGVATATMSLVAGASSASASDGGAGASVDRQATASLAPATDGEAAGQLVTPLAAHFAVGSVGEAEPRLELLAAASSSSALGGAAAAALDHQAAAALDSIAAGVASAERLVVVTAALAALSEAAVHAALLLQAETSFNALAEVFASAGIPELLTEAAMLGHSQGSAGAWIDAPGVANASALAVMLTGGVASALLSGGGSSPPTYSGITTVTERFGGITEQALRAGSQTELRPRFGGGTEVH